MFDDFALKDHRLAFLHLFPLGQSALLHLLGVVHFQAQSANGDVDAVAVADVVEVVLVEAKLTQKLATASILALGDGVRVGFVLGILQEATTSLIEISRTLTLNLCNANILTFINWKTIHIK